MLEDVSHFGPGQQQMKRIEIRVAFMALAWFAQVVNADEAIHTGCDNTRHRAESDT